MPRARRLENGQPTSAVYQHTLRHNKQSHSSWLIIDRQGWAVRNRAAGFGKRGLQKEQLQIGAFSLGVLPCEKSLARWLQVVPRNCSTRGALEAEG